MIIRNTRTLFRLWWKENLVKHPKVSKYYETDCLQNFLLFFMFLLTVKLVKNIHIEARIFSVFLKNVLKQTWNSLNTKFQLQWKHQNSSYQVRQILGLFLPLDCSNFRSKQCERLYSYVKYQTNQVSRCLGRFRIKKKFPETISHKISKTNSSFHMK